MLTMEFESPHNLDAPVAMKALDDRYIEEIPRQCAEMQLEESRNLRAWHNLGIPDVTPSNMPSIFQTLLDDPRSYEKSNNENVEQLKQELDERVCPVYPDVRGVGLPGCSGQFCPAGFSIG